MRQNEESVCAKYSLFRSGTEISNSLCLVKNINNYSVTIATMHDYVRRVNFTTSLVCEQNFLHLHFLCVGILFNSTALGIHFCETSLIFNFKTRLGGEICLCDVNMHKGYCYQS